MYIWTLISDVHAKETHTLSVCTCVMLWTLYYWYPDCVDAFSTAGETLKSHFVSLYCVFVLCGTFYCRLCFGDCCRETFLHNVRYQEEIKRRDFKLLLSQKFSSFCFFNLSDVGWWSLRVIFPHYFSSSSAGVCPPLESSI